MSAEYLSKYNAFKPEGTDQELWEKIVILSFEKEVSRGLNPLALKSAELIALMELNTAIKLESFHAK
jgi:hypothetical protein